MLGNRSDVSDVSDVSGRVLTIKKQNPKSRDHSGHKSP